MLYDFMIIIKNKKDGSEIKKPFCCPIHEGYAQAWQLVAKKAIEYLEELKSYDYYVSDIHGFLS